MFIFSSYIIIIIIIIHWQVYNISLQVVGKIFKLLLVITVFVLATAQEAIEYHV